MVSTYQELHPARVLVKMSSHPVFRPSRAAFPTRFPASSRFSPLLVPFFPFPRVSPFFLPSSPLVAVPHSPFVDLTPHSTGFASVSPDGYSPGYSPLRTNSDDSVPSHFPHFPHNTPRAEDHRKTDVEDYFEDCCSSHDWTDGDSPKNLDSGFVGGNAAWDVATDHPLGVGDPSPPRPPFP